MRIAEIRSHFVRPRWLFVEVRTDAGLVGWGEAAVEPWHKTIASAIHELGDQIEGRNPLDIEDIWLSMTRGRFYNGGPIVGAAVAAIDTALWDIAGKAAGAPIYELLGGPVRNSVRAYSWITMDDHGRSDIEDEEYAENAASRVAAGFTAVKAGFGRSDNDALSFIETPARLERLVRYLSMIREAIGPGVDLAMDLHGRCSRALAKQAVPLIDPIHLLFLEEPVLPPYDDAWSDLARLSHTPLATGERIYTLTDFKTVLDRGVRVLQPDVGNAGGISELVRIGHLARQYDAVLAPHCAGGPIGLAASLQLCFVLGNVLIQEQGVDYYTRDLFGVSMMDYLHNPDVLALKDGYFTRPEGPGLGLDIREEALLEHSSEGLSWLPPVQRRRDGTFADW